MYNLNGELVTDFKLNVSLEDNDSENLTIQTISEYINSIVKVDTDIKEIVKGHKEMIESGESELVLTMEGLRKINTIRTNLVTLNGISQNLGLEAISICPELNINVKKLTSEISFVNYKVSLEEIDNKMIAMIAAAVVAVGAILYKIVSWFRGRNKGESADVSTAKKEEINKTAEKVESEVTKANEEIKKIAIDSTNKAKKDITPQVINEVGKKAEVAKSKEEEEKYQSKAAFLKVISENGLANPGKTIDILYEKECDLPKLRHYVEAIKSLSPIEKDIIKNGIFTEAVRKCVPTLVALLPEYQSVLSRVIQYQKDIKTTTNVSEIEKRNLSIEGIDKDIIDNLEKLNVEIETLRSAKDKASDSDISISTNEVLDFIDNGNLRYIEVTQNSLKLIGQLQTVLEKTVVEFNDSKLPVDSLQQYYDGSSVGNATEFASQYRKMLSLVATFNSKYAEVTIFPDVWVNYRDKLFATGIIGAEAYLEILKELDSTLKEFDIKNEEFSNDVKKIQKSINNVRSAKDLSNNLASLKDANVPGCRNKFLYMMKKASQRLSSIVE